MNNSMEIIVVKLLGQLLLSLTFKVNEEYWNTNYNASDFNFYNCN